MKNTHRHPVTIAQYRYCWQKVKSFMMDNNIKYYDADVEKAFLTFFLGDFDYDKLKPGEKDIVNKTEALCEFQKTKRIILGCRKHPQKVFKGDIGQLITDFIAQRGSTLKLAKKTVQLYGIYLHSFDCYIQGIGLNQIRDIKASDILSYIKHIDSDALAKKHAALGTLRIFFRYLYENNILPADHSRIIPKDNYSKQPKLPSTFTDMEIHALLKTVDRGSPKGKRDYAMLLLATKLGLRASDICGLRFENIIWERNVISLNQHKTGKALELPLLPEIGNAIIDYLRYGRPISQDSNCFLHVQAPYQRMSVAGLGALVGRYMNLADISIINRRHGPHALRHCLASALLKEKVPLPVISEILGHKNMESSMLYLRIDIDSLRKCALEVPLIPSSFYSFYKREGGYPNE